MTRVLFVETGSGYGGSAKYLFDLIRSLDANKFCPFLLYNSAGDNVKKILQLGVVSRQMDLSLHITIIPVLKFFHLLFWFIFRAFPNSLKIADFINNNAIDVVYMNNEVLTNIPAVLAAKFTKRKMICHDQGLRGLTKMERIFARFIDCFVCISRATADSIRKDIPNKRIEVIHNALKFEDYDVNFIKMDSDLIELKKDRLLVGIFGRVTPWKGHMLFVEAAARVLENYDNVLFVIIGDDVEEGKPFLKEIKQKIADLGIADKFVFTGWKSNPKESVLALDIVIHPSIEPEPFGLSVIEAMALERPVIGSRAGGIPEIIDDGIDGLLFESGNAPDLALRIEFLLNHPDRRMHIGKNARLKVRDRFALEENVSRVQRVISEQVNSDMEREGK
ncbi:MAG: glycosyltransferase family 4 protein [Candidatus Omnitrophota bacterium]